MPRTFPTQPNLEHFRKQAKQLLRDVRDGDDDATQRRRESAGPSRHVVITGGAGFIGSHLAERLLAQGHRVTAFDDLSGCHRSNVAHLIDDPHFDLVVADICDADAVDTVVAEADVLFHLAASFGRTAGDETMDCLHTNVHGTEVVLESASRHGVRFLFSSTSAVYGNLEPGAILREEDGHLLGSSRVYGWDYALSKMVCEELISGHAHRHRLPTTSVRLFNVVGPRLRRNVVPTFLGQARRHEAITLHGDGEQSRCFTDVRDVVEGLVRLADCDDAVGETVNIGSRFEFSVRELAQHVKRVTLSDSAIETVPYDYQMVPSRVPCLSKARRLIGFCAVHPVRDTIREILALDDGGGAPDPA